MLNMLLLVLAFVCFVFASFGVRTSRVELVPLGLAFWVLSLLVR